jgi:hypothetical protein
VRCLYTEGLSLKQLNFMFDFKFGNPNVSDVCSDVHILNLRYVLTWSVSRFTSHPCPSRATVGLGWGMGGSEKLSVEFCPCEGVGVGKREQIWGWEMWGSIKFLRTRFPSTVKSDLAFFS